MWERGAGRGLRPGVVIPCPIPIAPPQGVNPQVRYSLRPSANHSQLFQVMPNGLLVARADRLRPAQTYRLQVGVTGGGHWGGMPLGGGVLEGTRGVGGHQGGLGWVPGGLGGGTSGVGDTVGARWDTVGVGWGG